MFVVGKIPCRSPIAKEEKTHNTDFVIFKINYEKQKNPYLY